MVQVRLFARAGDLAGTGMLAVELPSGATVADLRRRLAEQCPALRPLLTHSALAVNNEFADDTTALADGAEVALLPPVSGGAPEYALSVKQPWAALLVHGQKTLEIRSWPTRRRGRVLIHAAQIPDEREYAWSLVPPELKEATELRGGIVGAGEITACRIYRSLEAFQADHKQHLNDPSWFKPPLYAFVFRNLQVLPFRPCKGNIQFFVVEPPENLTVGAKRD
jgi:molybdopterin converting factor subunit 1